MKYILITRNPNTWADSFESTIYKSLAEIDTANEDMKPWLKMVIDTISKTGFPLNLRSPQLTERFEAHNEAVSAPIPQHQLC
jgi:hypothetical protein